MSESTTLEELRSLLRQRTGSRSASKAVSRSCGTSEREPFWIGGTGELHEWISGEDGSGAFELALLTVRRKFPDGCRWLVVDHSGEISPAALEERGCDLSGMVFVRSREPSECLWAVEQGLRSRGVDVVCCRLPKLTPVTFRRLKIAAEAGKTHCLLFREREALRETSGADVRLLISPLPSSCWNRRRLRVEVLKIRNGFAGKAMQVELDDEATCVRVVSELADSTSLRGAAGTEETGHDSAFPA